MPNNSDFEELYLQSEQAIREGDLIRAKQCIEQMLMEDPRSAIAHNSMGWFYRVQFEDYRKAEQHYRTALRSNPNYPHAYWNYVYMLMDLERFEDLERLLEQGMERPAIQKTLIFNQLGEMREVQGRFDEALWAYQQAIRRSTKSDQIETLWDAIERVEEKVALDLHLQQWEVGISPSPETGEQTEAGMSAEAEGLSAGLPRDQDRKERGLRQQLRRWRDAARASGVDPGGNSSDTAHGSGRSSSISGPDAPLPESDPSSELEQFLRGDWFKADGDRPGPIAGRRSEGPGSSASGEGPQHPSRPKGTGPTPGSSAEDPPQDGRGRIDPPGNGGESAGEADDETGDDPDA